MFSGHLRSMLAMWGGRGFNASHLLVLTYRISGRRFVALLRNLLIMWSLTMWRSSSCTSQQSRLKDIKNLWYVTYWMPPRHVYRFIGSNSAHQPLRNGSARWKNWTKWKTSSSQRNINVRNTQTPGRSGIFLFTQKKESLSWVHSLLCQYSGT